MNTLLSYVPFVIILVAMIVIHEFGHFIVAKILGISVETFSVGFGPRLLGFRYAETDYRISAIPLGGYVKFRGENLEMIQGKSEGSIDEFLAQPKWKRLLVAVAGPVFNIVTAILIPAIAILIGFQTSLESSQQPTIGLVVPGSASEKAGLQRGDRILSYNDNQRPTWEDFRDDVMVRPNEDIALKVERNGQVLGLTIRPEAKSFGDEQVGIVGVEPYLGWISIGQVLPNSPAARAGLQAGDKIIQVEANAISAWSQFKKALADSAGRELAMKVTRGQQTLELRVKPEKMEGEYRLGIGHNNTAFAKANSPREALAYGWKQNWRLLRLTGVTFKQIFAGRRSARDSVAGLPRMAQGASETYKAAGWSGIIYLMGILSLNLGIMNLLPIPVLDGGVILLIIVEALLAMVGKTLTMTVRERFQQVGFVMVLLLMVFVIGNDFLRMLSRPSGDPPAAQQPASK